MWRWGILGTMLAASLILLMVYGVRLGLDLQGGKRFVLRMDDAKVTELIKNSDDYKRLDREGKEDMDAYVRDEKVKRADQILMVINKRIDSSGINNPNVYKKGSGKDTQIMVELAGVKEEDVADIEELLTKQAVLEFRAVDRENQSRMREIFGDEANGIPANPPMGYNIVVAERELPGRPDFTEELLVPWSKEDWDANQDQLVRALEGNRDGLDATKIWREQNGEDVLIPQFRQWLTQHVARHLRKSAHSELLLQPEKPYEQQLTYQPMFIEGEVRMEGNMVANARTEMQPGQGLEILLFMTGAGREKFCEVTEEFAPGGSESINDQPRQLAIVLDDQLYSAPNINEPICGGTASITGNFSQEEARQLSTVLRAGAFQAPAKIEGRSNLSASLGADSIRKGSIALILGMLAVLIFMVFYYRVAGVVVNLALLVDILLLPLGMWLAGGFLLIFAANAAGGSAGAGLPVLTLPGIAGLVLTIGMAVDANVLIFERLREEQNAGKRFSTAVRGGFDKAFSTIFDANVTTLIVAIILYIFGSGPIRGFSVTLTAGIIVSVYTALVFTRLIFDRLAKNPNRERIQMRAIVKDTNIDFIGKKSIAAIVSAVVILGTWGFFAMNGKDNLGYEFTGGTAISMRVAKENTPTVQAVRTVLSEADVKDPTIFINSGEESNFVEVKTGFEAGQKVTPALAGAFPGMVEESSDSVGPQFGRDLMKKGIWSVLLALVGIVLYISFRFEFAFAVGAIAALLHDVAVTIGIFCLVGFQLNGVIIGALLTVVGYSVNDTIVVFDRIREDWELDKRSERGWLANRAINRTLGRTLMTSITTLLTVLVLFLFGGGAIRPFAFALVVGVLVGTYSSVFVATPVMLWVKKQSAAKAMAPSGGATAKA